MRSQLIRRLLGLEAAPLFISALITGAAERAMPALFLAAGAVALINIWLTVRDGAVLAHLGVVVERRKEPITFWIGTCVHSLVPLFCFYVAAIIAFAKT